MSGGDYRNRPSLHIPGKEFLIVVVVLFSSLSFTLGYFVGRSGRDTSSGPARVADASPAPMPSDTNVQSRAEAPGLAGDSSPAGASEGNGKAMQEASSHVESAVPGPKVHPDRNIGDAVQRTDGNKPVASKGVFQKGTISYTVQIGAFSSKKDSQSLRAKVRKKGYKAYIVPATDKKGKTIYKIRIGDFKNRKDAELLSLKLRKTEELNTFVTFKNE